MHKRPITLTRYAFGSSRSAALQHVPSHRCPPPSLPLTLSFLRQEEWCGETR